MKVDMSKNKFEIRQIGVIHSSFKKANGTPIQAAMAGRAEGWVEVYDEYLGGLKDLDGFERIWLIYWFDRAKRFQPEVAPYLDTEKRGLFSTRAPSRPNPIGISAVRLLKVEGNILRIADMDIIDNTPLLDIKPYAPRFDHFEVKRCGWLDQVEKTSRSADDRFEKE